MRYRVLPSRGARRAPKYLATEPSTPPFATMSSSHPSQPPRRVFGPGDSALDADEDQLGEDALRGQPRPGGRVSFSGLVRKPSLISRWRGRGNDEEIGDAVVSHPDQPAIPSALQSSGDVYTTSLPTLSMIVLSIVCDMFLGSGLTE